MIQLRFERYRRKMKPSDRATNEVDCYRFKIKIGDFIAAEYDQYVPFHEHVGKYEEAYKAARKYADGLADALHYTRPRLVDMIRTEVISTSWEEMEVADERIEP